MNSSLIIESQLRATKFYVPVLPETLVSRPRLTALLAESLKYPLTLISAPAGFGKTMLLSAWVQSLPANHPFVAWISLEEEDNDPQCFWAYVLSALDQQDPQRFTPLFKAFQSPQPPPLTYILTALINLVQDSHEHFVLVLDDYHVITEQQVHTTLSYLVRSLPHQLRIILATRTDPPLPLSLLRTRGLLMEVRTDQLRCTVQETTLFFEEVMNTCLPEKTVQEITARTEGWLVGLQLLGLSLQNYAYPASLLEEVSGSQRYILDYLTEVVLLQQPQEVQTFLLSTCILSHLTASLCDALLERTGSQFMIERLEKANLFVVSLDSKRQWYRYHALFAEALHYQLEQTHADLLPILHHRASRWYAEHEQTTEAILHAFKAHDWQWAADLIERKSQQVTTFAWGARGHQIALLQHWLERLPTETIASRAHLCLACVQLVYMVAPLSVLDGWLSAAEAQLTASLSMYEDASHPTLTPQALQEEKDLLGSIIVWHTILHTNQEEDGQIILSRCQQALSLLSEQNILGHVYLAFTKQLTSYLSSINDTRTAVTYGLQGCSLAQAAGYTPVTISFMGMNALFLIGAGQLHEAQQLLQQAILLDRKPEGSPLPDVGWLALWQAEILREWDQLDAAQNMAEEAILQCQQTASIASPMYLLLGYAMLLRISLSCGDLERSRSAFQKFEWMSMRMSQLFSVHFRAFFTTIDQVRLWLACGELDRATNWSKELDLEERYGTPFAREREEVACARVLLAKQQPDLALKRLEPVLKRATAGQRRGHVIEIHILQALAWQMRGEQTLALHTLLEAIHLAEPEGYIRSFVDEGAPMQALLSQLRERQHQSGPTPYLDTLLAAFLQQNKGKKRQSKQTRPRKRRSS